jgi:hypothetical protein
MASDGDFVNFRAVYDELTVVVGRARYQFLPDHLRNWFRTLDTTPRVSALVAKLQSGPDFNSWWAKHATARGMPGGVDIHWPEDGEQSLGMKLLLFRAFAEGKPDKDIAGFGFQYIHVGNNINDNARAVVDQMFQPMARELRRYLERELAEVPAADRVVRLDHNSVAYSDVLDALEKLEEALKGANDYPDPEDREQRVAEVSATRRLFQSVRLRVGAVVALLGSGVMYFATHLAGSAIDKAASAVVDAITTLIGPWL